MAGKDYRREVVEPGIYKMIRVSGGTWVSTIVYYRALRGANTSRPSADRTRSPQRRSSRRRKSTPRALPSVTIRAAER